MMNTLQTLVFMGSVLAFAGCRDTRMPLMTVQDLDLSRYAGTWYEIARLPNSFEKGLECVTATYDIRTDGKIRVINRGRPVEHPGKLKEATGVAWIPDPQFPGRLKVRFFWPFAGDYWIMALDDDYTLALVGDPSRKYLWILSKTAKPEAMKVTKLLDLAKEAGFDTDTMIRVNQDC